MTEKNKSEDKSDNKITKTIKTGFVSEIDRFFHDFDKDRLFPAARLEEIRNAKIIADKRDGS